MEPDVLGGDVDLLDMSVLFAADNVDHNIITIDDKGTFHGMGVIASVTLGKQTNHLIRIDILLEVPLSFKEATPNWQGMMHILHQQSQHPGLSSFLPMINIYSVDKSCIVSILDFICNLAMKHNLPTIVTFDQPLYWKAAKIIIDAPQNSHLKGVVLMLGCFHTLMNLLGAIGTLIEGPVSKTYLRLSMEKMQLCTC